MSEPRGSERVEAAAFSVVSPILVRTPRAAARRVGEDVVVTRGSKARMAVFRTLGMSERKASLKHTRRI